MRKYLGCTNQARIVATKGSADDNLMNQAKMKIFQLEIGYCDLEA